MANDEMIRMLLDEARQQRTFAAINARQAQQDADSAVREMQRLQEYQMSYRQRWGTLFRTDSSEEMVQSYRGFMSRLQARISSQERVMRERLRLADTARDALRQQDRRLAALRLAMDDAQDLHDVREAPEHSPESSPETDLDRISWLAPLKAAPVPPVFAASAPDLGSRFRTTAIDIDMPLIPSWHPLDAALPRGF